MIAPVYPDIVRLSARMYREDLVSKQLSGTFQPPTDAGVDRLIPLLRRVEEGSQIDAAEVAFTVANVQHASQVETVALVNEWSLGWGRDDAKLLVMGTEEAYAIDRPTDVAQWHCGCAAGWASGGRREVIETIDPRLVDPGFGCPPTQAADWDRRREFHVHANDYFRVHLPIWDEDMNKCRRPGRSTWKLLSEVIAGRGNWRPLLEVYSGTLGDLCHQVEVSAYPARQSVGGMPPTAARLDFLGTLVETFRKSARVLLFHGRPYEPEWGGREGLGARFLGLSASTPFEWTKDSFVSEKGRVQTVWYNTEGERTVILTRALNGSVQGRVLDRLHQLVGSACGFSGT